jgi:hypothetical protein
MTKVKRTNPGSYQELRMWAEAFADAQQARIAFENKDRSGTVEMDAFGEIVEAFQAIEERCRKEMVSCYQVTVPQSLRDWQARTAGIGESTLARLLGITGDPRMAYPKHWEGTGSERHLVEDEPHERTIGQLWQYCGHGAPKNRHVAGDAAALMANGQPDAKKLVHLMAAAQVKTNAKGGSGYRWKYDAEKAKYAERVHSKDCEGGFSGALYVKCKTHPAQDGDADIPAGSAELFASDIPGAEFQHPDTVSKRLGKKLGYALKGDPYQPSHVHAIALRHTGKEILRDLWLNAGPPVERKPYVPREAGTWPSETRNPVL